MPSPRRPTVLGQAPGPKAPSSGGDDDPERSLADSGEEERTTVEEGPPQNLRDRWEEKTVAERASATSVGRTTAPGPPPAVPPPRRTGIGSNDERSPVAQLA